MHAILTVLRILPYLQFASYFTMLGACLRMNLSFAVLFSGRAYNGDQTVYLLHLEAMERIPT